MTDTGPVARPVSPVGLVRRREARMGAFPAGINVDAMTRTQRRLGLLQTYAPEFVTASPAGALAAAEAATSDDDLMAGANEATGFANVERIHNDLRAESTEVQRTVYDNLPATLQRALGGMGYTRPDDPDKGGGGRLFGSIPVLGDITERVVDWGSLPGIGGAAEEAQHFVGEGLQPVGQGLDTALTAVSWPSEQVMHGFRAGMYALEEGQRPGGWTDAVFGPSADILRGNWTPSEIAAAWNATDEDDGYIRPGAENRARRLLEGDDEAYTLAHDAVMGRTLEESIIRAGYELGSVEANRLVAKAQSLSGTQAWGEATNAISTGQVSFGRVAAQDIFGLEDTDGGLGRFTSGLFDAGFTIFSDPTLAAGAATKFARFGRNAFRLESAAGRAVAVRQSDAALMALRAREGSAVGTVYSAPGKINSADMRQGRRILSWADRVSRGFAENDFAGLMRDMPDVATGLGHMSDYHIRQLAQGGRGLDDTLGVVEYLQNREELLALMGTRLGGASPKVWGIRMPTYSRTDRRIAQTKEFWSNRVEWSRFVGATPERSYGPQMRDLIQAAGSPRDLGRQSMRWLGSRTFGAAGRTMAMLTSHTPYRDYLTLDGADAIPEFTRLINTGLFGGMSRQTMDDYVNAFTLGDISTRAKIEEQFLDELFRRGGIHETPFAERFIGAHRQAYALDPSSGSRRLVDVGHANAVAIPDVRRFLNGADKVNFTRQVFHSTVPAAADAALAKFWKPAVLIRLGFIARAAGEELLHSILKNGARVHMGAVGAAWGAKSEMASKLRIELAAAEAGGRADDINRIRHALADVEGSMMIAPIRALLAGGDRMATQLFASTKDTAGAWRHRLAEKAERFDPMGSERTVRGIEAFADDLSLRATGVMRWMASKAPGDITKASIGRVMAERWNPYAAEAARDMLANDYVMRAFAEEISGSTMMPWEYRPVFDENGLPIEKVTWAEFRQGGVATEEVLMRELPEAAERRLDRVLDDPTFFNSLYTRHNYSREDRVSRAVVDAVLPRWVGPWRDETTSRLAYDDIGRLREDLNKAWSHEWSPKAAERLARMGEDAARTGFEGGADALGFLRRYIDDAIDEDLPKGWIGGRLKDLFDDAGTSLSAGKLINFLDDPKVPQAAKRWLLYDFVDPGRLIDEPERLRTTMRHAARGRLGRPDMYPKLRENRLYAKGETLARPVARGISKVYVPLMPADYVATELADDFIEAAAARVMRIGGYGPVEADTIARNAAAASVNPGLADAASRIGMVPLGAWGAADPRVADAILAAAEDVTGIAGRHGILEVPDDVVRRSTDRHVAQGLLRAEGATDFAVEPWRLLTTRPTESGRRYAYLNVGDDAWEEGALDAARQAYEAAPADGTTRLYSGDHSNWVPEAPDGPFWFADVPSSSFTGEAPRAMLESFGVDHLRGMARQLGIARYSRMKKGELIDALMVRPEMQSTLARQAGGQVDDAVLGATTVHRLPGAPGTWTVEGREISDGIGEIEALEAAADRTVDELLETLTTFGRDDIDDDVLHEIVEPLKRPTRRTVDDDGVEHLIPGYQADHLRRFTSPERLPTQSYGPKMVASRDLAWNRFVREWFDGPVNKAVSSIIRKPMFITTYGEQLRNVRGMADLLVDPQLRSAVEEVVEPDKVDSLVRNIVTDWDERGTRFVDEPELRRVLEDMEIDPDVDLDLIRTFARQQHHALTLARDNALNRAMQLTIPYIDDHRIRSAFQNYVGNFIPFLFAEEQFLKRWARSVSESPEMIRKAQLAMNGLRSMGTVRRDEEGNEIFTYPFVGDVAEVVSHGIEWMTGKKVSLPYSIELTGAVGYTLPGFGDQMGMPSAGPLVGMGTEFLSRMYPELAEVEEVVIGRGANRPLWQYVVPTGAGRLWEAGWGDIDKGQLASAMSQAVVAMAANGQLPPETATPEERQEFVDRASAQTRFIIATRGMFGLTAPAAPQVAFAHDELTEEFRALLNTDVPFEQAITMYLANHPEANPDDILAATVPVTEAEFPGADQPTEAAFRWVQEHNDLVEAYPAAAAWLMPRAEADDPFSRRAYNQQLAKGMRARKAPKDLIDDIYFRTASEDYFTAREAIEERTVGLSGSPRQTAMAEWAAWKDAYFKQHPLFAAMLADPERQQKRTQAIEQLTALSRRTDEVVPPELAEMMATFEQFQLLIASLRGDRRSSTSSRRSSIVSETAAWMQWHIARHPHLSGPYLRLLEPVLREADEDAVMEAVDA